MMTIAGLACLSLCIFAALHDVATLKIPNWLNATIAGLGLSALAVSGLPLTSIGWHGLVALIAFIVSFGLFSFGVFGGGDAKMIPAVALWMGPVAIVPFLVWTAFIGGGIALIGLAARYAPIPQAAPNWVANTLSRGEGVPYGVAIAGGALMAASHSPLLSAPLGLIGLTH
ncbi:MAG: prepilin peptidase [Pseudomonadota bacterium]